MKPISGTRKPYSGQTRSLVLALDVGTTFSGVSYAILEPGEVPKIHGVTRFPGQEHVAGNSKIPSVMYYDQHGNMKAAGAEADGAAVLAQAEDEGWIKTELFKLRLRPKSMTLKMNGMRLSPLPHGKTAVDVFGDFLSYLFRCTHSFVVDTHANGHSLWRAVEHDIQFVLSHPNGWEGAQQTKMRRAAVIGGLIPDVDEGKARIRFVTEGEASLHACVLNGLAADVLSNTSGHGFIVADAGGGTLDISSYGIRGTSPLVIEEIAPPDCVFAGSVFVSRRARSFFAEKLKKSKYGTPDSLDHITKRFDETTKRLFRNSTETQFVPFGSPLDKDSQAGIRGGHLRLTGAEVAELFEPSIEAAVASIRSQIQASSGQVKSVWLVGGFAASPWLFTQLQERLTPLGVTVSRPDSQTSKAVADGAIGFYCDHHVSARVSKFMYGVEFLRNFDPEDEEHASRKHRLFELPSGPKLLPDAFDCILSRGVKVKESTVFSRKYCTEVTNLSTLSVFEVEIWCYRGGDVIPKWILRNADNFSTLCYVRADLSPLAGSAQPKQGTGGKMYWTIVFSIEIHFGLTEFKARIKWLDNGTTRYGPASIVYNESGVRAEEEDDLAEDDNGTMTYTTTRRSSGIPSSSSRGPSRSGSRAASVPQSTQSSHIDLPPVTSSRGSSHRTSSYSSSSRSPELDRHHSGHTSRGVDLDGPSARESRRSSTVIDKGKGRERSSLPSAAQTPRPERMTERDRSLNFSTESRMSSATARLGDTLTSIWGTPSVAPSSRQTPLASPRGESASYFESTPGALAQEFAASFAAPKPATPPTASKVASPPLASGVATPTPRAIDPEGLFNPDTTHVSHAATPKPASRAPTATVSKAPTAAPSKVPTAAPSKVPTAAPSRTQTAAHTAAPSKVPTAAPSRAPTVPPSKAPSVAQSKAPSAAASKAPSAAQSKAPSPTPTPKIATPAETPRAANTPGATTPRASAVPPTGVSKAPSPTPSPRQPEAPLPPASKVATPAASKAPSKVHTPVASKVPTPTAVSKASSRVPSKTATPTAVSKAVSRIPSPKTETEPLPEPTPPTRDPNDDSVVPPRPEEPLVAPANTGAPEPAAPPSGWGAPDHSSKSPSDHGLDDLWTGDNKAAGFGDFLTSNDNWNKAGSATSASKRNSTFGAAHPAGGSIFGGWSAPNVGVPSWGANAANAIKSTAGGWARNSLTNAFGAGGSEGDITAGNASVSSPIVPGSFDAEQTKELKSKELKLDLPPVSLESKTSGTTLPSTPITPGGSKGKRAAKKAEEEAAAKKAEEEAAAAREAEEIANAAKLATEEAERHKAEVEVEEAATAAAGTEAAPATEEFHAPGTVPVAEEAPAAPVDSTATEPVAVAADATVPEDTPATETPEGDDAQADGGAEQPTTPAADDPQKNLDDLLAGDEEDGAGEENADEEKEEESGRKNKKGKNKGGAATEMSRTTSASGKGKKKKGKKS